MCDHRNLHVRAPSFPTRRSSDLFRNGFSGGLCGAGTRHPALALDCLCRFRVRTGSGDGDMSTAELGGIDIRKTQLVVEEIWHERGPVRAHPVRVATAAAVVGNPFAGRYEQNLIWFQERMRAVGRRLSCMLLEVIDRDAVEAFGKGAIVGED